MNDCISCNNNLVKYTELGEYCPNCFSVFTKKLPSQKELNNYYNQFNIDYHGGGRSKGAVNRQIKYANLYMQFINKHAKGKYLIDIGSSNNPLPNIAYSNGYQVTIADFIKPNNLNSNITFIKESIENIDTSDSKKYDVVTAFAVIEHTRHPLVSLGKMIELCKSDGIILIYIPEIGHFSDINALGTSGWYSPPEHLNLLSKKCLKLIMSKNNCELINYSRFELSRTRYLIRYGIGLVEGLIGIFVKSINSRLWLKIRQKRISKHTGMAMFVFRKK